jgi:hypothetical protein
MALTQIVNDGLGASLTATSEGGAVTTSIQQGIAKSWINFNGTGTIASRDSFSVSSISDTGTGETLITFSNAFNSADSDWTALAPTTTAARVQAYESTTGNNTDRTYNLVAVHGDLA